MTWVKLTRTVFKEQECSIGLCVISRVKRQYCRQNETSCRADTVNTLLCNAWMAPYEQEFQTVLGLKISGWDVWGSYLGAGVGCPALAETA